MQFLPLHIFKSYIIQKYIRQQNYTQFITNPHLTGKQPNLLAFRPPLYLPLQTKLAPTQPNSRRRTLALKKALRNALHIKVCRNVDPNGVTLNCLPRRHARPALTYYRRLRNGKRRLSYLNDNDGVQNLLPLRTPRHRLLRMAHNRRLPVNHNSPKLGVSHTADEMA